MRNYVLIAMAILLAGCAHGLPPMPAPDQTATTEAAKEVTAVDLDGNEACRKFTKQVEHPNVVGMNARVAWKAADHALSTANGRIQKADDCMAQQAKEYRP